VSAVNGNPAELARRLTVLSERFVRMSAGLAEAGRDLLDRRILPAEVLAEELAAVQADFEDLRNKVVAAASALAGGAPPPVTTIRELEVLVHALAARAQRQADEETGSQRRAAEEAGKRGTEDAKKKAEAEALHRLTEEEAKRKAEAEAKRLADEEAKRKAAEEAKRKSEEEARRRAEEEAKRKAEEAKRKADEEAKRKAAEEEAKRKAAEDARRKAADDAKRKTDEDARRRVAAEGQAQAQAKAAEARRKAEEEAKRRAEEAAREQGEARRKADAETRRKADEQARRRSEEEAARREAEEIAQMQAQEDARRRATEQPKPRPVEPASPTVPEHRPVEPEPEPVAAAEDEGQDLGLETAQWWISASANWASLKAKQTAFPTAVHDTLTKYPYVFSVPIQSSADYEDGLLAYGYAVLLDHVEQRRAGFVEGALNNLPARQGASLGRRLYDYLAAALRDNYAEFVKTLMLAALPRSPLWVTGGIEDSDAATAMFTRPTAKIGDPNQKTDRATQDAQRFADRQFTVEVGPLTTRFFRVEAGEVRDARTVEIKLTEKSAPSDQAWLVMVPRTGAAQARRHERQGTTVSGMGKDYTAVWVGVFNTDVEADKRFELTVGVRRRVPAAPAAGSFRKPR
jgi:membrane protein involved in colicin uptake